MRSFNIHFSVSSLFQLEWVLKNWCFCIVVLESPLDCREIKPVNPKGNKTWIFTGRTDVEAEAPILRPPDVKNWLVGKKKPLCWERLKAGEGDRGWDGWMASPTWWRWVRVSSGSWWWTGKPGMLHVIHGVAKHQTWLSDWTELNFVCWRSSLQCDCSRR